MTDIELTDIVLDERGPSQGWSAVILCGDRLAAIVSGNAETTVIGAFLIGSETTLAEIRDEIADDHPAATDPLDARCRALVGWEWLRREVAEMTADRAVGVVEDEEGVATLVVVEVPEGGELGGAVAWLRAERPDAVVLNGLDEDAAVAAYARTAG